MSGVGLDRWKSGRSGAAAKYPPANFLPQISQVQFVSGGVPKTGLGCVNKGQVVPFIGTLFLLNAVLICPLNKENREHAIIAWIQAP